MSCSESSSAPAGGAAVGGPLRLDCDRNKSTWEEAPTLFIPVRSGGRLHPTDGLADRCRDQERLVYLIDSMRRPCLLTLTVDRKEFDSPLHAWKVIGRRFSQLVSQRMGCKLWVRVLELQTGTGDGWPHLHALIDLGGTRNSLSKARKILWKRWRDEWHIGGGDLAQCRSRRGSAKYLAKYVVKGLPAIPSWMLEMKTSPRMIGWSRAANDLLRLAGLRSPAVRRNADDKRRGYRSRRTLLDRLAESGKSTAVVVRDPHGGHSYLGTLPCSVHMLAMVPGLRATLVTAITEYGQIRTVSRSAWNEATLRRNIAAVERHGAVDITQDQTDSHREAWLHSWDLLQDRLERGEA
jgi:hypothetical protein